jgi:hypothetical protein
VRQFVESLQVDTERARAGYRGFPGIPDREFPATGIGLTPIFKASGPAYDP